MQVIKSEIDDISKYRVNSVILCQCYIIAKTYHIVGLIHASGTFLLNAELQKNIHLVVSVKPRMNIYFPFHPSNSLEQSSWTIALCFLSSQ